MAHENQMEAVAAATRAQAAGLEAWEQAELHLLDGALRDRLSRLGLAPSAEIGATLMVVAQLLAEHSPEWGGDVRSTLAEVALLGLRLLEDAPEEPRGY
ncbi:MAG: hypothetical protein M3P85_03275 [Actinomycetota bacterium]|nr:hypothetical protein [Actinomycetota bacterium]